MSVFLLLVNLYSLINKGVNDIHNQVADDNHGSYKYSQSQCHRIVTVSDRIYKIPAQPRNTEYLLNNKGTRHQRCYHWTHISNNRKNGVLQCIFPDHHQLRNPLAALG